MYALSSGSLDDLSVQETQPAPKASRADARKLTDADCKPMIGFRV